MLTERGRGQIGEGECGGEFGVVDHIESLVNPLRPKGHICPALFECNFQRLFLIYVNILHVFHRDKTFKYP